MNKIKYAIKKTAEFKKWFAEQNKITQTNVDKRLARITDDGHFGDSHDLETGDDFWELRWANGLRLYYAYIAKPNILVLLGGTKNGQKRDIKRLSTIKAHFKE